MSRKQKPEGPKPERRPSSPKYPTTDVRYHVVKLEHPVYERLSGLRDRIMASGIGSLPPALIEKIGDALESQSPRHKTLALSVVVDLGLDLLDAASKTNEAKHGSGDG